MLPDSSAGLTTNKSGEVIELFCGQVVLLVAFLQLFFEEYFAEIVVIVVIFDTDISNTSSGYFLNSFEKRVRERELER